MATYSYNLSLAYSLSTPMVLKIGQAIIMETNDPDQQIKYLISAPTMRVPENVENTPNAYLAFRATLLAGMFFI